MRKGILKKMLTIANDKKHVLTMSRKKFPTLSMHLSRTELTIHDVRMIFHFHVNY